MQLPWNKTYAIYDFDKKRRGLRLGLVLLFMKC